MQKGFQILTLSGLLLLLAAVLLFEERWCGDVPPRPSGVPANAAFLHYPYTGFPGPPRGRWMFCWQVGERDRCKLLNKEGRLLFEGEFVPADGTIAIPAQELVIAPERTSDEESIWTGEEHIPLVKLRNGKVLIPAFAYEQGKKVLNESKTLH